MMELSWDAIGAVGEILGATAVLITLLYLVKQLEKHPRTYQRSGVSGLLLYRHAPRNSIRGIAAKVDDQGIATLASTAAPGYPGV